MIEGTADNSNDLEPFRLARFGCFFLWILSASSVNRSIFMCVCAAHWFSRWCVINEHDRHINWYSLCDHWWGTRIKSSAQCSISWCDFLWLLLFIGEEWPGFCSLHVRHNGDEKKNETYYIVIMNIDMLWTDEVNISTHADEKTISSFMRKSTLTIRLDVHGVTVHLMTPLPLSWPHR